ncbi:MAG: hypothetical protein ACLR6J_08815 [Parabacteroides merdae]
MTIILLLFGMIGYKFLGVREFPSVDNPIISVSVTYPGSQCRSNHEPDYGAARTEYQRYSRHSFAEQCQQSGKLPYHGRV